MTGRSPTLLGHAGVLAGAVAFAREALRALLRVARENLLLLFIATSYFTIARVAEAILGAPLAAPSLRYPGNPATIYWYLLLIAVGVLWLGVRRLPPGERVTGALDRTAMLALTLVAIPFVLNTFGDWKLAIPRLRPFSWDARLAEIDRALHFGHDPWRLLQPLVGHPMVTWWLDYAYFLWFPVTAFALIWQACSGNRMQRAHYLLAYVLLHPVLGTAAALYFSSAGPCYYRLVAAGPDPFAGLLAYLGGVNAVTPLFAMNGQWALWRNYVTTSGIDFLGISAMPSLHIAVATLVTLAAWRTNRAAGWAFGMFTGLILIGSIHLGWHYAVDGYAAIVGTVIVWWASGVLLRRYFAAARIPLETRQAAN